MADGTIDFTARMAARAAGRRSLTLVESGPPQQSNAFGFEPIDCTEPPPRFDIRGYVDGWQIFDRGELIVTVRGPRFEFASKILRQLREDAERDPPPFQPAA